MNQSLFEKYGMAPTLLTLTGPTGSGKTYLMNQLLVSRDGSDFTPLISHTTRPIRSGELNGRDYIFTTVEDFEGSLARGEVCQHVKFQGHYYGTYLTTISKALDSGKVPVVIVEPSGVTQFERAGEEQFKVKSVFVSSSRDRLISRYLRRVVEDVQGGSFSEERFQYHVKRLSSIDTELYTWKVHDKDTLVVCGNTPDDTLLAVTQIRKELLGMD